jgi:hypothetical protein
MRSLVLMGWTLLATSCVVDLADNIVVRDPNLDEAFFYCVIQPRVLTPAGCSGGIGSEAGQCHGNRTSFQLREIADVSGWCTDGQLTGVPPSAARANFDAARVRVQVDPFSSPLYRRPIGLDPHPPRNGGPGVIAEDSLEAMLIADWITSPNR